MGTAELGKERWKTTLVGVKSFAIPVEYWTTEGLSHIASYLGVPLYADEPTMKVTRISVVTAIDGQYPEKFMVEIEFGSEFEMRVEYGWLPKKCEVCQK